MKQPGKVTESWEEETEEYNSGPTQIVSQTSVYRLKYLPRNVHFSFSSSYSLPYVNEPKLIIAITDTNLHVTWNCDESNSCEEDGGEWVMGQNSANSLLTLNLPTTTIDAQPFNSIKWQLKFNPVA